MKLFEHGMLGRRYLKSSQVKANKTYLKESLLSSTVEGCGEVFNSGGR